VLDWFHVGMRFENLKQVAKGINGLTDGGLRDHALAERSLLAPRSRKSGYAPVGMTSLLRPSHCETRFSHSYVGRRPMTSPVEISNLLQHGLYLSRMTGQLLNKFVISTGAFTGQNKTTAAGGS
jgi:hypothetical protein